MLISVGSGLHSQAWKKTSTVAAILLSMTASLGKSAASGAGGGSAWKGGREDRLSVLGYRLGFEDQLSS
jgi:hypothetical protein